MSPRPTPSSIVLLLVWIGAALAVLHPVINGEDFASVYLAGQFIHRGQPDAVYAADPIDFNLVADPRWHVLARETHVVTPATIRPHARIHRYLYLPLWAGLASVLPASFPAVNTPVLAVQLLVFGLALWLATWHWCPSLRGHFWLVLLSAATVFPFRYAVTLNQPQLTVVACVIVALVAAEHQREGLAGALLAVAITIKLTPALFLAYWLRTRRSRGVAVCLLTTAGIVAVSIAWLGVGLHREYLHAIRETSAIGIAAWNNQSLVGMLLRATSPVPEIIQWRALPVPTWIQVANLTALCLGMGLALWTALASLSVVVWLIAMPLSWAHYFIALMIPLLALWAADRKIVAGIAWALLVPNGPLWFVSVAPFLSAVLLGWSIARGSKNSLPQQSQKYQPGRP